MLQSKHKRNQVLDQNINPEKEAQAAVEQVMPQQKKPGRKALQIFAIVALLVLVAGGVYAWQNNRVAKLESQVADLKKAEAPKPKPAPVDPYAGWKTYTLPEDSTISFKYPSDWNMDSNMADKTTKPYNRFVRILSSNQTEDGNFVFRFYYSAGKTNQLTNECADTDQVSGPIQNVTVDGNILKLRMNTTTGSAPITSTDLVDNSDCYIATNTGVIKLTGGIGTQAPGSMTAAQWNASSESKQLNAIMKSLKY